MGSSVSSLEAAQAFSALLTDQPIDENVEVILTCPLGSVDMSQALPIETMRALRHLYTRNFALLLYKCISQVSKVAEARHTLNASASPSAEYSSPVAMTRFETALRILQRVMPVALEAGTASQPTVPTEHTAAPPAGQPHDPALPSLEEASARPRTQATGHFQRLFFAEGRTCEDAHPDEVFPKFPHQTQHRDDSGGPMTLGAYLVWALVECCFTRHIALPSSAHVPASPQLSVTHSEVHQELLWYAGVATEETPKSTHASGLTLVAKCKVGQAMHGTRKQLLLALVGVLSTPLYHTIGFRDELFTEPALSTSVVPLLPTLSASLLNAVLTYMPYGAVPYSSYLVSDEENVIVAGTRLLCALLCYPGAPIAPPAAAEATRTAAGTPKPVAQGEERNRPLTREAEALNHSAFAAEEDTEAAEAAPEGGKNAAVLRAGASPLIEGSMRTQAQHLMSSDPDAPPSPAQQELTVRPSSAASPPSSASPQHGPPSPPSLGGIRRVHSARKTIFEITFTEAGLLLRKLRPIIGLKMYVRQTILPDSQRGLASHDDFMMLLWKLIDLSPAVSSIFASDAQVLTYLLPLIEYAMDARGSPAHTHRLQLVLFILLRLSAIRSFAIRCNQPFTERIPFPFPALGQSTTYNDVLVVALCVLTDLNEPSFTNLLPSCTTVVANLAPYIVSLSATASTQLTISFTHVAQRCLRSKETVCSGVDGITLNNLCESAASILQYNQSGSHHLIVALAQHRNLLQKLVDVFLVHKTKVMRTPSPLPFLVDTLQAAVAAAQPLIESTRIAGGPGGQDAVVAATSSTAVLSGLKYDEEEAVAKLKDLTLVGVLPTPHRIIVRRFQSTRETDEWATVTSWTTCYMDLPLGYAGDNMSIQLFTFEQPQRAVVVSDGGSS